MRIIGGRAAGTRIEAPKGSGVRPTLDRVREAIFNRLAPLLPGATVLDLFGGTGAMALESISRGAKYALSVERSAKHGRIIAKNIKTCDFKPGEIELRIACVFATLRHFAEKGSAFNVVLADPPFGEKTKPKQRSKSLAQQLIDDSYLPEVMTQGALFVLGHASRDQISIPPHWAIQKSQRYGDATINFLTKADRPQRS